LRFTTQDFEVIAPRGLCWDPDQDLSRWAHSVWRGRRVPLGSIAIPAGSLGLHGGLREPKRRFPFEVSILYDFTPLLLPWTHAPRTIAQPQQYYARDLPHADAVVAISQSTRADASWLCDVAPERIVVGRCGPSLCTARHLYAPAAPRRQRHVGLVVSTLE